MDMALEEHLDSHFAQVHRKLDRMFWRMWAKWHVREAIASRGLTYRELAKEVDITEQMLANYLAPHNTTFPTPERIELMLTWAGRGLA
jgi:hypothetical protein